MQLYDHQKLGLSYLDAHEGFGLFHEQGLGKTLTSLVHLRNLVRKGEVETALVVAPKAAMGAWWRDIEKFNPVDQLLLKDVLIVVNYDLVWRREEYRKPWDCVLLDESHKIKNRTARRSKFILNLSLKSKYRYILTGTPIGNGHLEDIWSQFAFLYPYRGKRGVASQVFGTWTDFLDQYCVLDQYWKPYRYVRVDALQEVINQYSHRVTKAEALDLPEKLPDQVYDMELLEKAKYKELHHDNVVAEFDLLAENPLARMTKLRQLCSGFLNIGNGETVEVKCEKLAALEDFLDGWEKKLVIFAEFKQSIRHISSLLRRLKIKHVILDGEQKDKAIWRQFQSDPSIRVFIGQYQSASTGIDLFAADTILYYEPTLSSNLLEQSRDRIHRIGQNQKCSYLHFITKGTVEVAIYKALKGFSDFNERLFTEYMETYTRSFSTRK